MRAGSKPGRRILEFRKASSSRLRFRPDASFFLAKLGSPPGIHLIASHCDAISAASAPQPTFAPIHLPVAQARKVATARFEGSCPLAVSGECDRGVKRLLEAEDLCRLQYPVVMYDVGLCLFPLRLGACSASLPIVASEPLPWMARV